MEYTLADFEKISQEIQETDRQLFVSELRSVLREHKDEKDIS